MKYLTSYCVCIIFIFNIQVAFSQTEFKEVKAKIEIEQVEDVLSIVAMVENLKSEYKNISFILYVSKTNKTNTNKANNSQDGRATLEPLQKTSLSSTRINIDKTDQIMIALFIYDENNVVIGKDKIMIGGEQKENLKVAITKPVDGIVMKGIVSNDTKTKLGNDFYDLFFKELAKLNANSSKTVTVQEELTYGRTTKIIVDVEGEIVDEFIAKPDEEFLEYMAVSSSSKVYKYFAMKEKQDKSIFQY